MKSLMYFLVMAAAMLGLSRILPGFEVRGWIPAICGAIALALVNAIVRPILFVLTLPFTLLTLGLFLLVINAVCLKLAAMVVPGFSIHGWGAAIIAGLILAAVSMVWKNATAGDHA